MSIKVSCSVIGMSILLAACGPNESQDTPSKELLEKQTPITKDNWEKHSTIVEAKTIVRKAESALNEGSLEVLKTSENPYDNDIWSWERHLDEDKTVLIVERWRGSIRGNNGSWESRNYYNQDGKLVFTDFSFQSEYVDRENWDWSATLYFDATDESLFWIAYKQLTPPNFPGNNSSSWRKKELMSSEYRWDLLPSPFSMVNSPKSYRGEVAESALPTEDEYVIKSNEMTSEIVTSNEPKIQDIDASSLILQCRVIKGDVETDIFFEHDLTQSFLYEILNSNDEKVEYKYTTPTEGRYQFNRETKILTKSDRKDDPEMPYAICNNSRVVGRQILETDKNLSWKINDQYVKPDCLSNTGMNVWQSFDNYEEYYKRYLGKVVDDPLEDKEFVSFYKNVGLYLNKEIPINESFIPSWSSEPLSLSLDLTDCVEQNPTSKVHAEKSTIFFSELKNIELEEAKVLAPHIQNELISVKEFTLNDYRDDGHSDSFNAIFGIVDFEGKLFMVPLKNE